MSIKVSIAGGKYTVLLPETAEERLCALRHDEPWRDCVGDNLVYWLAVELQELRDNQAKVQLDAFKAGMSKAVEIANAKATYWKSQGDTATGFSILQVSSNIAEARDNTTKL